MNTHNKIQSLLLLTLIFQVVDAKQYMFSIDFIDQLEDAMFSSLNSISQSIPGLKNPSYDIQDLADTFVVKLAVPGLSKDDVEIVIDEISDGTILTVRAEVKQEEDETDEEKTYHKSSVYQQSFSQKIRLAQPVIVEAVQADLKDGILTITLPKAALVKKNSHSIKVH